MTTETVAGIDARLFMARWGVWHATWNVNLDELEAAMAVIDALLDQRYELMHASARPAALPVASTPVATLTTIAAVTTVSAVA